jgi:hypothetical protein
MALKAVVEKLDDAPEAVRSFYQEKDGKFVLGVEEAGGFSLEDVSGLKSALHKERGSREQFEREVGRFKDIDPDKAREALAKFEEFSKLDPAKEADKIAETKLEAIKAQLVGAHDTEIKTREERIQRLSGAVDNLTRQQQATAAIAEAKGSVELLLPHVLAHTRVKEGDDGSFRVEVVDAQGNTRINNQADPITVKDLVAEMRANETFARAFDGDGHSGSGKQPDKTGGLVKANMGGTPQERAAAIAQKYRLPA